MILYVISKLKTPILRYISRYCDANMPLLKGLVIFKMQSASVRIVNDFECREMIESDMIAYR